jgi:biopolymer transport protein ExbD
MAGSDDRDNPVAVNVVPLVDIIFCLCVFFMCSFKFKQLEGKFDAWLPKSQGAEGEPLRRAPAEETRVALEWDRTSQKVVRRFAFRRVDDDEDLRRAIEESHAALLAQGVPDAPVTIDAGAEVPWQEVVRVVDLARAKEALEVQFAAGAAPAARARR